MRWYRPAVLEVVLFSQTGFYIGGPERLACALGLMRVRASVYRDGEKKRPQ